MSCPFGQDDAAYVLGALSPQERLDFERHLGGCRDCTRAVRELAGIPGLLSRVNPEVLMLPAVEEPLPAQVLPGLARAARRSRRRRLLVAAGSAAAAAAVVASAAVSQLVGDSPAAPEANQDDVVTVLQMAPVGDVPVVADLGLETVTWGTRLQLTCTYDTGWVSEELPPRVDYILVVRTADGHSERVGSWKSLDGRTMQLTAATAATRAEIAKVEVRAPDGRVVLTWTA